MKKVFVINGGYPFAHSPGKFNETLFFDSCVFFESLGYEVKSTQVGEGYDIPKEIEKFIWADLIVYHTPIWWFQIPYKFKEYFDLVLTEGHEKGLYKDDGRSRKNPTLNYGTGGLLKGKKYILTTSWNAPEEAFTLKDEFFNQTSVDDGVMFGFHRMNAFLGIEFLASHHFHDIEKNADIPVELTVYNRFLEDNVRKREI